MESKKYPIRNINLILLVLYMLWIHMTVATVRDSHEKFFTLMFLPAFLIGAHVALLFIAFIVLTVMRKKEMARQCLISMGLVLLIGFSTCWGGIYLYGNA